MWALARRASILVAAVLLHALPAAADYVSDPPSLIDRLTPEVLAAVFPEAVRLEPVEGPPAAVAVFDSGDALVGYIFSTLDLVRARGFSSTPFDVIGGVLLDGTITGVKDVFHREPHIYNDDRRTELLARYFESLAGAAFNGITRGPRKPDFVSGATISARAMAYAVGDSARMVMRSLVGLPEVTEPTIDLDGFAPMTFAELAAAGSVRSLTITNADLEAAFAAIAPGVAPEIAPRAERDPYITFSIGLASVPMIGRNLVDNVGALDRVIGDAPEGAMLLIFGSQGRYDFQGIRFLNASSSNMFDRVEVRQGERTFAFHRGDFVRAPSDLGTHSGLFVMTPESGFDPMLPWTAVLKVHGVAADGSAVTASFPLDYTLPALHILLPEPPPEPILVGIWREARADLVVMGLALMALTGIFVFQRRLARHRRLHRIVRIGFLTFTVVWIGYIAGAQLSITHVVTYLKGPFQGVDFTYYLVEPLIVVLGVYVLLSLVLIGRGVFCGWLCPFGALQELVHRIGRFLRLPDWTPSGKLQRLMWLPKYGTAAIVLGTAFLLPGAASSAEEIEPFKTAITSAFVREWPFVVYAVAILCFSLFTERAFCRFLCPLGGVLAVLDRMHILSLLKRRPQCGSPCQLCAHSCPVGAIVPSGRIVMAECFQCLDCQVEYYDDRRCPPLSKERKARERAAAIPAGGIRLAPVFAPRRASDV